MLGSLHIFAQTCTQTYKFKMTSNCEGYPKERQPNRHNNSLSGLREYTVTVVMLGYTMPPIDELLLSLKLKISNEGPAGLQIISEHNG